MGKQLIRYYSKFSLELLQKKKAELENKLEKEVNPILKELYRDELFIVRDILKSRNLERGW